MTFFQLRSVPGAVWPQVPALEVSQVWSTYRELDRTQWLNSAELERLQFEQVRYIVSHCIENVPYYRAVLGEAGIRSVECIEDFRRIPFLTRTLYQTHFTDLQAQRLPAGTIAAGESYTSGTNGVPIKVLKTNRCELWWRSLFLRDLEWCGLDPRGSLAAIRLLAMSRDDLPQAMAGVRLPTWSMSLQTLLETGPAHGMDIRQDPQRQLEWLRRVEPDYLLSLPTNLEFLAGLIQESGRRLDRLRAIQSIGEPLAYGTRQRIEAGFSVPLKNTYSSTEAGYMASPCPQGHGLHVHAENILAEVLDADDRPCRPGQTGRLVFTTLHNFRAPFLRYEIMDDVTLAPGPCPCGRGLPLWTHVDGRRHALLFLPDGRRKSSLGITLGIRKAGGSRQFQIVQRAKDRVLLRVVPDRNWNDHRATQMRTVVQQEFESPIRVDIETHSFLQRPAGGKLRMVVVELEDGDRPA